MRRGKAGFILIQPWINKAVYNRFKAVCHSRGVTVEQGIEAALAAALESVGVKTVNSHTGEKVER
jgi:hypothetical protein